MYAQILIALLLCSSCYCYEEDALKQALGGGLTEGLEDLMTSFGEAIDGLADLAEGKTIECKYKCRSGIKAIPHPDHTPTSNGCGSFGIEFDTGNLPQMTECCDVHDKCYDICNTDKETCDKDFRQCLLVMCGKLGDDLNKEEAEVPKFMFGKGCEATAEIMYRGTLALGCSPYKKAQKNACLCNDKLSLDHKAAENKSGTKIPKVDKKSNDKRAKQQKKADNIKKSEVSEQEKNSNTNKKSEQKSDKKSDKKQEKVKPKTSRESGDL
ncbi:group XIIA secretory phospholipase A2-like isoform X1 [Mytilus trossulus]|uniref:group XIIA secretory phospholipase A2-like isoform X1 n=1 Tax=Mytilus trossulus TaxID=6551 RepID=UPI0030052944